MEGLVGGLIASGALAGLAWVYYAKTQWQAYAKALKLRYQISQRENVATRKKVTGLEVKLAELLKDPITGLPSKTLFDDRLTQSLREAERFGSALAVVIVEINEYAMVETVLSAAGAAQFLQTISARLQACVRQMDSIARLDKGRFVLMFAQLRRPEAAVIGVNRILQVLATPIDLPGQEVCPTVAMGIAVYPIDSNEAQTLFRYAESALQVAKTKGIQQYHFFHENAHENAQRELSLAAALQHGLTADYWVLRKQAIVEIQNAKPNIIELELAWQHPNFGLVSGESLRHRMERLPHFHELFLALLDKAIAEWSTWQDRNTAALGLAVPCKQLEDRQFVYHIAEKIQSAALPKGALILFLQPSSDEPFTPLLEKTCNMLDYAGVKLAMDGFGMGAIAWQWLSLLPLHYLRLDPAFMRSIESHPKMRLMLTAFLALARELGAELIVTGVDTETELRALQQLEGYLAQGAMFKINEPLLQA